jgi:CheY-like chemotaxis protein
MMTLEIHSNPLNTQFRVLVAEDGLVNRHLAERLLQREGCEVITAENGELAVNELDNQRFDLVLMDVEMPVMDGLAATRTIRERERQTGNHTPIVALTSNTNREQCIAAGMDAFLSKPLRLGALREVLGDVLDGNAA